jgi:hypothetical protein
MAARLVKVFHVRLNVRDVAVSGPHPLAAYNREVGAPRVLREQKAGLQKPAPAPLPPRAATSDDSTVAALRALTAGPQEHRQGPLPPRAAASDDSSIVVLRDDEMVAEDRGREQRLQTDAGLNGLLAKPRERRSHPDERLSIRDIALTMAAVIVVSLAATAFLPSLLLGDIVDPPPPLAAAPPPVEPPPIEQAGVAEPAAVAPAVQPPAPAPRATASSDSKSAAQTTPALRAAIPPEKQAGGRVTATGRNDLTAAEKAAVARGLSELKSTAALTTPRRPAATRPALSDEEKAAIERGLRELEKDAGQAKQ